MKKENPELNPVFSIAYYLMTYPSRPSAALGVCFA
jgi:hypothetical protein